MLLRLADRPQQLGPYQLVERLAQGGMAVVYKARLSGPSGFEKTVVVKALLPALCAHEELVELFSAEARLSAQLNHPNIVQVLDFGVAESTPYLVMEYLDGWTLGQLRDRLAGPKKGRFPVGAAVKIARDVCLALGYAHNFVDREGQRRQVIHRDVSPSNIMLCRDGSVKLLDFGIARVASPAGTDLTNSFRGKYAYMAPEQVKRQPLDRRVDVFAAGTVLHEMLTGKRLFASVSELETLERVAKAQVTAPSGENPEVPRALDAVVKRALSRDRDHRYSSGAAMAEALETLDSLLFSRKKLTDMLKQLFPEAWSVICEVCGKQVLPGRECSECGSAAPEPALPDAPAGEAQPLPPPPRPPARRSAANPPHLFVVPKLPSRGDEDSVKMGLPVHKPVSRPAPALSLADESDDEPPTIETRPPQLEHPAPRPASLPTAEAGPLAVVLTMPSSSRPQPLWEPPFPVTPELPPPDLRSGDKGGRWAMALLCVGMFGIGATLMWKGPGAPAPRAVSEPAAPQLERVSLPLERVSAPPERVSAPPERILPRQPKPPTLELQPVLVTSTLKEPKTVTRPARVHRRHRAAAPSSTVRDGRIVDPFQGSD